MSNDLRTFVEDSLQDDLSPAAIAGRLNGHEHDLPRASKDSIYRYLKSPYGRKIEYERNKKRKQRRRKRTKLQKLENRKFIEQRPKSIEQRSRVGDIEGDFIVSGRMGKGILLVVVDRKLRTAFLEQILDVSIARVHESFLRIKERFPEMKTMTTDNDILFRHHEELERLLHIKIYFCHPYHSWEKGSVENANKYIRKDIRKGSDLSKYSKTFIQSVENKLNRRPMRCLKYFTPSEVLIQYRKRKRKKS